jgi:hypothetical protein
MIKTGSSILDRGSPAHFVPNSGRWLGLSNPLLGAKKADLETTPLLRSDRLNLANARNDLLDHPCCAAWFFEYGANLPDCRKAVKPVQVALAPIFRHDCAVKSPRSPHFLMSGGARATLGPP